MLYVCLINTMVAFHLLLGSHIFAVLCDLMFYHAQSDSKETFATAKLSFPYGGWCNDCSYISILMLWYYLQHVILYYVKDI